MIREKVRARERRRKGVGVMKDKELKHEDVEAPHTLGGASDTTTTCYRKLDPTK
jgi:hypothetical protein